MQSCGFPSSTSATAFINSPCPYLKYDCDTVNSVSCIQTETPSVQCLARAPLYRSTPFNYVYPTSGKEKDFINTTKNAIILQKKYHAYRKIWNCDPKKILSGEGIKTASWKFWPPPLIVPVPDGLKIPIKYERRFPGGENLEPASDSPCCLPMPTTNGNPIGCYVSGEDEVVEPITTLPSDEMAMTKDQCLRGVLNTHESEQFIVQPPSVLFLNSKIGQYDTVVVKVRNKGMFPRRMSVISPQCSNFDVIWGAGIGENTLLAPGLTCKIIVRFNPPKSGRAINDMMTIIIDDDGAIVVPIIAENSSKPILEMEEWDVGCSLVNNSRISTFEITNRGGGARFWVLSEEEFTNEYLELRGPKPTQTMLSSTTGEKQVGKYSENPGEEGELSLEKTRLDEPRRRTDLRDKMLSKADHLVIKPFKLFPSCFNLQRNQSISIQIRYRPREPAVHLKKLVMLCDNGEVRWLVVKGIGIDPKKNPLIEINGKWMAPPVDLPADLNTRITIDCGDLLPGEKAQECFTLKNNSCMPLYFFWSIRHMRPFGREMTTSKSHMMEFQPQGLDRQEWADFEQELNEIKNPTPPIPVKIYPAQGILSGRESLECSVFVQAPMKEDYHNCVLSIFIQQIGEQAEEILVPMMKEINNYSKNNTPIAYESLIETLPKKKEPELPGKRWKRPKHKSGDKGISNFIEKSQEVYNQDIDEEEEEIGEEYAENEDFNDFLMTEYNNKKNKSDPKKKRGECKQWSENEWSLGPMHCPIICLQRAEYDDDDEGKGTKKQQLSIVGPDGSFIKRQGKRKGERKMTAESDVTEGSGKITTKTYLNGKETMKFKSPKLNFPPMPFFYIANTEMSNFDTVSTSFDMELRKLEFPKNILSGKTLEKCPNWFDGESGDEFDTENEFKYKDYFGKICISSTKKDTRGSEEDEEIDMENYEDQQEENDPFLKRISYGNAWENAQEESGEFLGEDQNPDEHVETMKKLSMLSKTEEKEPKTIDIDIVSKLEHDGCVLLHRFEEAKKWLDESSPIQPMEEIEIWSRTIPLQCSFDPPQLTAHGQYNHKVNRSVEFVNHTKHQVQLTLDPFVSEVGTIICRPFDVTVDPWQSVVLHFTIDFRHKGNHEGTLKGTIKLPFSPPVTVPCWLPFRLMTDGPSIKLITPLVNFGLIVRGTEHVKTIVLRNEGSIRTKWRATIPPENLQDEDSHELSYPNNKVKKLHLLRAWPECGTIEPYETLGIQIYLGGPPSSCSSTSQPQTISACCEIQIEEDPEHTMYITILAEMQSPSVILLESRLVLRDVFKSVGNFSIRARLKNLRSFHTPFKWGKPIGAQADLCQISMSPSEGVLPAKGQIACHIKFFSEESILLNNLFLPCSIGGLKEPLILKIEGAVFSLCLKIVIPKTKLSRIKENDLPWHCRDEIWPKICGLSSEQQDFDEDEEEPKNENCTKNKLLVNYLGKYGKYCLVKHFEIQAPPPSVSGKDVQEKDNDEEEGEDEGENDEEEQDEEEEEEEQEELAAEKAVKGKKSKKLKVKKSKSKSKSTKEKESKTKQKGKKTKSKSKSKTKLKSKSVENKESTQKQPQVKKPRSKKTKSKLLKNDSNAQNGKKDEGDEPQDGEKKEKTKGKKKKGKKSGSATPRKKKQGKNKEKEDALEKQTEREEEDNQKEANEEEENEGEDQDQDEEKKYQIEFRGENPFECLPAEDDQIETMVSEGRLIYFQIKKKGEVATVQFSIYNEAPINAAFTFKVQQYPVKSESEVQEEKKLQPRRFINLDSEFFEEYKKMERKVEQEDILRGKKGAIFNVFPSEGILQAFHSVDVTVEFHANVSGLYEDQLECYFEGLENPYIIKLEALAILCKEDECQQQKPESSIPGEAGEPQEMVICTRKLNPLLY